MDQIVRKLLPVVKSPFASCSGRKTAWRLGRFLALYQAQTRPLVEYYSAWAASGDPHAPRHRRISGTGTVEQITERALAALA